MLFLLATNTVSVLKAGYGKYIKKLFEPILGCSMGEETASVKQH